MNLEGMLFDPFAGFTTTANATPILGRLKGEGSGRPRTDKDGSAKTTADGRPTYSADVEVLTMGRDGNVTAARGVFINTVEPVAAKFDFFGQVYLKAEGKMTIKPFVSDGRLAYSITVDRLVPVNLQQEKSA